MLSIYILAAAKFSLFFVLLNFSKDVYDKVLCEIEVIFKISFIR